MHRVPYQPKAEDSIDHEVDVKASERPIVLGGSAPEGRERLASSPVSLALLDRECVIVSVNRVWADFARDNGGDPALTGVGMSYLDVCAAAGDDPVAGQVVDALQSAVRGGLPAPMAFRIPCHGPDQQRWFNELISSRFTDDGECVGAMVTLEPSVWVHEEPNAAIDEMLDHAVGRLVDAENLLDGLSQRLDGEVDKLTLTATFENLDAVIRDLRPRHQWRHR